MAINQSQSTANIPKIDEDEDMSLEELELSLPKKNWYFSSHLYFYHNFWLPSSGLQTFVSLQAHFQAQDTDIVLATKPKSGTTWLKAITFAILNRQSHGTSHLNHPLATSNPHDLVPCLEYTSSNTHLFDLSQISPPRLMATHLPYHALPECVRTSGSRIVYMCRNPFDMVISMLEFKKMIDEGMKEEEVANIDLDMRVDDLCRGVEVFGPHWDHVLGYWNVSLENPDKVLFMKYEEVKANGVSEMKRLARFLGVSFTPIEEESGVVDELLDLCSFEKLKEMEVNKSGRLNQHNIKSNSFFRKGEVGDWKNHFSPSLFERLDKVMQEKFHGSGLIFKLEP